MKKKKVTIIEVMREQRQTDKKNYSTYICPNCGDEDIESYFNFCPICGVEFTHID